MKNINEIINNSLINKYISLSPSYRNKVTVFRPLPSPPGEQVLSPPNSDYFYLRRSVQRGGETTSLAGV